MRGNARLSVSDIRRYYFGLLHAQLTEFGIFAINCFKVNALFSYFWSLNIFFFYTFHKFHQKVDYAELFMSTVYSILNHSVLAKARTVRALFSHRPLLFFCFICQTASISLRLLFRFLLDTLFVFLRSWHFGWRGGWESAIKKAAAFSRGK